MADELGVNLLNEIAKIFFQFFQLMFVIMGLPEMNTSQGKSPLMMALVFAVVLYYVVLVLVKILMQMQQLHIRSFLLIMVIILLGSVVSVLALMMISPTIAWIALTLCLFIFASVGYYNRQELYQLIPERIKNLIEGHGSAMSSHNSEIGDTQDVP